MNTDDLENFPKTENASSAPRRHLIRHRSREFDAKKDSAVSSPSVSTRLITAYAPAFNNEFLLGLSIAGVAATLLMTIYSMFHVDVFLRVYGLPYRTYSIGSFIVSLINTANDLAGAWVVDHIATTRSRSDLVGAAGCLLAVVFIGPFFRSRKQTSWDAIHFIVSVSLYDTISSFVVILVGSVVNDNHHMADRTRVAYIASGRAVNLIADFIVARLALVVFDVDNLMRFRLFITVLALSAAIAFLIAQRIISHSTRHFTNPNAGVSMRRHTLAGWLFPQKHWHDDGDNYLDPRNTGSPAKLRWRQVVSDFWGHKNFLAWIGMEILLEAQTTFVSNFLKTFIDGLVLKHEDTVAGMTRRQCDLLLAAIRPMTHVTGILIFVPIQMFSYPRVYRYLFLINMALSCIILFVVDLEKQPESAIHWICLFLCVYPVLTGAVQSGGFHLAHADMVLEMKRKHASEDRRHEPSLAGLFLGANFFFCKPFESALPITAAQTLQRYGSSKASLFYLLVIPPILCSVLQLFAWRMYDLTPCRVAKMRSELRSYYELGSIRTDGQDPISPYSD